MRAEMPVAIAWKMAFAHWKRHQKPPFQSKNKFLLGKAKLAFDYTYVFWNYHALKTSRVAGCLNMSVNVEVLVLSVVFDDLWYDKMTFDES